MLKRCSFPRAVVVFATAMLASSAMPASAPHEEPSAPAFSLEAEYAYAPAGFDRRWQAIEESLRNGKNPAWAGRYYEGENLGEYFDLSVAPDVGATMTRRGTFGYQAANHGPVTEGLDGVIRISFAAPNDPQKYYGFPDELVPIDWSGRHYLVPPGRVAEFVSSINHGYEPRHASRGRFLMREGDGEKPATGLPALPSFVQAYVRRKRIDVKVISVELLWLKQVEGGCADRYRLRVTPVVTADLPLFVGEQLRPIERKSGQEFELADVKALHGASADAELFRPSCDLFEAPKPGDRFTTGAYKERQGDNDEE